MQLDTEKTIYFCKDSENSQVKLLIPRLLQEDLRERNIDFVELNLSDPDPESTDAAEFKLLAQEMEQLTFEV